MLFLVALVYLLLCVRLRVQIDISIDHLRGGVTFRVGVFGVNLRHEQKIVRKNHGVGFCLEPSGKTRNKKKGPAAQRAVQFFLMPYLRDVVRQRRIKHLTLHVSLGLGDACETAVAVGASHALLCALAAPAVRKASCDVRVTPDFDRVCFQVSGQSVFFCQMGDVLLAAVRAEHRKKNASKTSINLYN